MDEQKYARASQPTRPVIVDVQTTWNREEDLIQCRCSLSASFLCHTTIEFSPGINVTVDLVPDTVPFESTFMAEAETGGHVTLFLHGYPGEEWQCVLTITFSVTEISFERHERKEVTNILPLKVTHNGGMLHLLADTPVVSTVPHHVE